jgi:hypothetical protein
MLTPLVWVRFGPTFWKVLTLEFRSSTVKWVKWVKFRLWLAHWPSLAWQRRWGGWRGGEGALRVDALLSPLLHSESASRMLARLLATQFCFLRGGRSILAGFFLFPRVAKYNTCFFVVILASSRACCCSFFCVECFRGIVAQCPPYPPCFGTSVLYFFEILSCGSKYWRQTGESAGFRTLVWRYCVAQVLAQQ